MTRNLKNDFCLRHLVLKASLLAHQKTGLFQNSWDHNIQQRVFMNQFYCISGSPNSWLGAVRSPFTTDTITNALGIDRRWFQDDPCRSTWIHKVLNYRTNLGEVPIMSPTWRFGGLFSHHFGTFPPHLKPPLKKGVFFSQMLKNHYFP